jgi:hypothetical protein
MARVLGSKKYEDRLSVILGHESSQYRPLYCSKAQNWVEPSKLWQKYLHRTVPSGSRLVVVFQTHDSRKTVGGSFVKPAQVDTWVKVRHATLCAMACALMITADAGVYYLLVSHLQIHAWC